MATTQLREEAKAKVLETFEKGNLQHIEQRLRIEYLRGFGNVTPKVIIGTATTGRGEQTPRSFRTDSPERLREIIKCLIKCLHQLELDTRQPENNLNDFNR